MNELMATELVAHRADLTRQINDLRRQVDEVNARLIQVLDEDGGSVLTEDGTVTVTRRRTFKPALAEQIIAKRLRKGTLTQDVADAVHKQVVDPKALEALLPDVHCMASPEGAQFVIFREARQ